MVHFAICVGMSVAQLPRQRGGKDNEVTSQGFPGDRLTEDQRTSGNEAGARDLIAYLTSPDTNATKWKHGMEPPRSAG